MAEEKTYVFGESANNGILGLLGPMLSQRGVDPNVLLAMQGRNNDGFGEGGWFIWVIFLFFLMGWGGNGFGNNGAGGLGNQLNNDYGREMLLQAINGNGNAISQLATTLNCDINAVQSAINSVQSQIQSVGNQVGMSGQQIINAIQAGNCQIASQIASCCCDVRTAIERQGYEGQLATLNQTNTLGSKIDQQTTLIILVINFVSLKWENCRTKSTLYVRINLRLSISFLKSIKQMLFKLSKLKRLLQWTRLFKT